MSVEAVNNTQRDSNRNTYRQNPPRKPGCGDRTVSKAIPVQQKVQRFKYVIHMGPPPSGPASDTADTTIFNQYAAFSVQLTDSALKGSF